MILNRHDEAIDHLKTAAEKAIEFDNRPDEYKITSFLLGEKVLKKTNHETTDSRSLREILRDTWLSDKVFDIVRDTEEFKGILEQLS